MLSGLENILDFTNNQDQIRYASLSMKRHILSKSIKCIAFIIRTFIIISQ